MKNAPCKTCARRGCGAFHDSCPQFAEWRASVNSMRNTIQNSDIADRTIRRYRFYRRVSRDIAR